VARRGKFLTPSQRILIAHILGLSVALALTMLGGVWAWLAAIAATVATISTVSRLLVQRSARIVFTRSLEPVILVLFGQLYIGLLQFCILYTPYAADDTPSSDLGGRRINKKTNNYRMTILYTNQCSIYLCR